MGCCLDVHPTRDRVVLCSSHFPKCVQVRPTITNLVPDSSNTFSWTLLSFSFQICKSCPVVETECVAGDHVWSYDVIFTVVRDTQAISDHLHYVSVRPTEIFFSHDFYFHSMHLTPLITLSVPNISTMTYYPFQMLFLNIKCCTSYFLMSTFTRHTLNNLAKIIDFHEKCILSYPYVLTKWNCIHVHVK